MIVQAHFVAGTSGSPGRHSANNSTLSWFINDGAKSCLNLVVRWYLGDTFPNQ